MHACMYVGYVCMYQCMYVCAYMYVCMYVLYMYIYFFKSTVKRTYGNDRQVGRYEMFLQKSVFSLEKLDLMSGSMCQTFV